MIQRFSEGIKNRVIAKLGGPTIAVELDEKQMEDLFADSIKNWYLYASLSKLDEKKIEKIQSEWTENYFQALCKETLGRIRGKFRDGLTIPGVEKITLDFESLLRESEQEKENLIGLLIPSTEKIILAVYVNVGNMDNQDVKFHMEKIRKSMIGDRGYKYFFIAVREQETRIECIYPNFINNEEVASKLNVCLNDIIKNIKTDEK
jgi:hypothetical protein